MELKEIQSLDHQIKGLDFFEAYAPFFQRATVWLRLVLEYQLHLKSKKADATAAFLHATLEENVKAYVEIPFGVVSMENIWFFFMSKSCDLLETYH